MALKEQRLRGMLADAKAEILAGTHFRTSDCFACLYGRAPDGFKLSLQQAELKGEIFSVEYQGLAYYPDYAFLDNEDAILIAGLAEVITVLRPSRDGWGMAFWFRSPNNFLGGQRPEDVLHQAPQAVFSAACVEIDDFMPG